MAVAADAAVRKVGFRALLLDPGDVILRATSGNGLAADQKHRRIVDEADRLESGLRIVAQVVEQTRCCQQRDVIDEDCRSVWCGASDSVVRDRAAAPDLILDDDAAGKGARQVLADEARYRVGSAAGRIRDDQ